MNINKKIYLPIFIFSILMAIEIENASASLNNKYSFIGEIYDQSWALLIGINKYQNVRGLDYAVKDAQDIQTMLVDIYNFKQENIILLQDEEATKSKIIQEFSNITNKAGEKDRVLIFFAGHGQTEDLPGGGEIGYLMPVGGDKTDLYITAIEMDELKTISLRSKAKHILYLIDACYGGIASVGARGLDANTTTDYLQKITKYKSRQIISAGGRDEEVIEKAEWGHSAFTKNLLSGLRDSKADIDSDNIITAQELGAYLKKKVTIDSDYKQTPKIRNLTTDEGEFVFISQILTDKLADTEDDKLKNMETEMAQIKELLIQQSQSRKQFPNVNTMPSKAGREKNIKTAATLAWIFPGMGHYYFGRTGKGALFTGLELAALTGIAMTASNYSKKVDEYNTFVNNKVGGGWSVADEKQLFDAKNAAIPPLIGTCTAAGIVWLWNIWDVKKYGSSQYSYANPVSIGINSQGWLEARVSF